MELKFVWIKEYKNIKNLGFNFNHSIKQKFEFIHSKIIISSINETPEDFFANNISGITAVVGKNGAGKTNLTEFINYNLAHVGNHGLSTYMKSEGIIIIDNLIFIQNEIHIENIEELKSLGYSIIKFDNAPLDNGQGEMKWHLMEKNKYVYYSPSFDSRTIYVRNNLVNISTTSLIYNDYYNSQKLYSYFHEGLHGVDELYIFEKNEKSRICDFALNFKKVNKYIDYLSNKIKITIDHEKNNYNLRTQYFYNNENLSESENETLHILQNSINNIKTYELSKDRFKEYLKQQKEGSTVEVYNIPIIEQKQFFFNLFFIQIFQTLINSEITFPTDYFRQFLYEEKTEGLEDLELQEQIEELKVKVKKIIDNAEWYEFDFSYSYTQDTRDDYLYKTLGSLEYSLKEIGNKNLLNETITLTDAILNKKRPFSYEIIGGVSSGQQHLLSLFSRFFWAKNEIKNSEERDYGIKGESILIFIDEGEITLHPEWQRTFFDKIITYLSELFIDYKIQLILTTHSPFVLSDIPKDFVIFLDKDLDGNSKISNIKRENTFGANIYSLLSDSFFMQNTIGSFAEKKMKLALEILTDKQKDYNEKEILEIKYLISSIGEPIIKEQFENLYNRKFKNEDEISELKKRIIELETEIKNKKNDNNNS